MSALLPITIVIPGAPVAKGRPRLGRGHVYTPEMTRAWEAAARWTAKSEVGPALPHAGPVRVSMRVHLPIPRSWSMRKVTSAVLGEILPTGRPDLDNYIKIAMDACNGIVFRDDAQVVAIHADKKYGVVPGLIITVYDAAPEPVRPRAHEDIVWEAAE